MTHDSKPDEFVSIVMPTLNEEDHILSALDSITDMDGSLDYEILVMDGGSTDHTRQLVAGTMGVPCLQPKAVAKPGWLTMAPLARKWSGEWGSVRTCWRTCSGREFSHQFCAKAM